MKNMEQGAVQKGVMVRIRANDQNLSNSEKEVSAFVSAHPEQVIHMSLVELANAASVSDATALRFARAIGFSGFNEMKMALVADMAAPVEAIFEEIDDKDDIPTITRKVFQSNIQLLHDTMETLDTAAMAKAVEILQSAVTIYVFAVGTSGPLAEVFNSRLFRLGLRSFALTDAYLQVMQAAILTNEDVLVAISRSGFPPNLCDAVEVARKRGAQTIAITCDSHAPLAQAASLFITAVSREIRNEAIASPVPLATLLEALYVALAIHDKFKTVENQRLIWEAMKSLRRK